MVNLYAFLLGGMLTLAFAPFGIFPFAVLSLAGLLALWLNTSRWQAFRLGWWFGVGLFSTGVYWIYISVHDVGDVPMVFSVIITGALVAFLALYPALVGYCLSRFFPTTTDLKVRYAFPALWTLGEFVRSSLFTGFPWLMVGYSQTYSPLKGFAPIVSAYGVSLIVAFTSGLLVNAALNYRQKQPFEAYKSLFAILTMWIAGALLTLHVYTQPEGKPINVALVQGNIAQTIKWSPEHVNESLETYANLTEPLFAKDKLIIWPEAAIPMSLQSAEDYVQILDDKARKSGAHLFIGIPIKSDDGTGYYNSIATLGDQRQVYIKRLLVPFGEYVPFSAIVGKFFDFLDVPMSNMLSGADKQKLLEVGDTKLLPAICSEIAYPSLMFTHDSSMGVIVTVTNDAWFGKSIAQAQHLQMAAMRAMEFQRPLLFASNDGITAIIDANGNILEAAPTHQAYVLQGSIQPRIGLTPWMMMGSDPLMLTMLIMLVIAQLRERKIRKLAQQSKIMNEKGLPQT